MPQLTSWWSTWYSPNQLKKTSWNMTYPMLASSLASSDCSSSTSAWNAKGCMIKCFRRWTTGETKWLAKRSYVCHMQHVWSYVSRTCSHLANHLPVIWFCWLEQSKHMTGQTIMFNFYLMQWNPEYFLVAADQSRKNFKQTSKGTTYDNNPTWRADTSSLASAVLAIPRPLAQIKQIISQSE